MQHRFFFFLKDFFIIPIQVRMYDKGIKALLHNIVVIFSKLNIQVIMYHKGVTALLHNIVLYF